MKCTVFQEAIYGISKYVKGLWLGVLYRKYREFMFRNLEKVKMGEDGGGWGEDADHDGWLESPHNHIVI